MDRRPVTVCLAVVAVAGCAGSDARAAERCAAVVIDVDESVVHVPAAMLARLRARLLERADFDRCARMRLSESVAGIRVDVALPDGRFASRTVAGPEDLLPTIESLLLVPSGGEDAPAVADEPAAPLTVVAVAIEPPGDRLPPIAPARASSPPSRTSVEVGVGTGARIGAGQAGFAFGAIALYESSGWLAGAHARADQFQSLDGGMPANDMVLGAIGGRRLRLRDVLVDVLTGPALGIDGNVRATTRARDPSQQAAGEPAVEPPPERSGRRPRAWAGGRVQLAGTQPLKMYVGIDGEIDLVRSSGSTPGASLPPPWSVGLVIGASVGSR